MSEFATFDDAFAWLASHTNYEKQSHVTYDERTYGLARVERLLSSVGHPDRRMDVVQIVGSKGKGSTATLLAAALTAGGRRTGLFTSPHLAHPRERVRVNGAPVDDQRMRDRLGFLRAHAERAIAAGEPLTFFELHTTAALLAMEDDGCDAVVLEAGMGGRLDATTAAHAIGVVLTTISLDHTKQLGTDLASIAAEKAAAARTGRPFICGEAPGTDAHTAVTAVCGTRDAPVITRALDFDAEFIAHELDETALAGTTVFRYLRRGENPVELTAGMAGAHQAANASLAATAALRLPWREGPPSLDEVRSGLATGCIRARLEPVAARPLVVIDGAHTPRSLEVLSVAVADLVERRPCVFVIAMNGDKDVEDGLRFVARVADHVVACTVGEQRSADPARIADAARAAGTAAQEAPDPAAALARARELAGPDGAVIVTGSLYLCGALISEAFPAS